VLLVDDEPDIRKVASLTLRALGKWDVCVAGSCEEALAVAEAEQPDLILLDVMMPRIDGPMTLRRLRAIPALAAIPIIFLTARVTERDTHDYLALGAAGIIAKPFEPTKLAAQVRAIVDAIPATA
jgi:two-component system OmpR family response regulator